MTDRECVHAISYALHYHHESQVVSLERCEEILRGHVAERTAAKEAEVARLQAIVTGFADRIAAQSALLAKCAGKGEGIERLTAEVVELRAAIQKIASHSPRCDANYMAVRALSQRGFVSEEPT